MKSSAHSFHRLAPPGFLTTWLQLMAGVLPLLAQDPAADYFQRASLGGNWTRFGGCNAEIVNGTGIANPRWEIITQIQHNQ